VTNKGIPVIDLFAGPGGLSEGFARVSNPPKRPVFDVRLSIEMDKNARKTLFLRSFRRNLPKHRYFDYQRYLKKEINLRRLLSNNRAAARSAFHETWRAELGPSIRDSVRNRIDGAVGKEKQWVLIGGPPCQAYSLAGRSRMLPVLGAKAFDEDPRHQLYKEYLWILADHQPSVFIFENVRGLLSSKLRGEPIFERIYSDLKRPSNAFSRNKSRPRFKPNYRLFSLTVPSIDGIDPSPKDLIVRSENYGVPQNRHRVIILGIDERFLNKMPALLKASTNTPTVEEVIGDLPKIRSELSRPKGTFEEWQATLSSFARGLSNKNLQPLVGNKRQNGPLKKLITTSVSEIDALDNDPTIGSNYMAYSDQPEYNPQKWYRGGRQRGISNHESRSHIFADLHRYMFASSFAQETGESPTLKDFPSSLMPEHKNAIESAKIGKFADRFRVQVRGRAATTITSHISKDGHYFIHYDPVQCRSLTVREAARIQSFPDDYHFEGPRTDQYKQVGNAVPPYLAFQIAEIVRGVF